MVKHRYRKIFEKRFKIYTTSISLISKKTCLDHSEIIRIIKIKELIIIRIISYIVLIKTRKQMCCYVEKIINIVICEMRHCS